MLLPNWRVTYERKLGASLKCGFAAGGLVRVLCPVEFAAFGALFSDVAFFIEEGNVVFAFWKAAFQELTQVS
jgi:hypothetical protein